MKRRTAFVAFLGLVLVSVVTPVGAEEWQHCNNKVCDPGSQECVAQTNGPNTHCLGSQPCAWDTCD